MSRDAPSMTTPLTPFNLAESASNPPQQENSSLPPLSMTMTSPGLRRFDRRRAEMLRRLLQACRFDLHRHRPAGDLWTRPLRPHAPGRALETQTVQRIRHRAGVEFDQSFDDRFTCHSTPLANFC